MSLTDQKAYIVIELTALQKSDKAIKKSHFPNHTGINPKILTLAHLLFQMQQNPLHQEPKQQPLQKHQVNVPKYILVMSPSQAGLSQSSS